MKLLDFFLIPLCFLFMELYFMIAKKYGIVDIPKDRGMHAHATIRGGGIVFLFVALWALFMGYISYQFFSGILIVAVVGLLDDMFSLTSKLKLFIQIIALVFVVGPIGLTALNGWLFLGAMVLILGWVNTFNFMDGINGITATYALSVLVSLSMIENLFAYRSFILILIIGVFVFGFYNVRKNAVVFAGDIGSLTMGFILGLLITYLMITTANWYWIFLVSVYGIDSVITIVLRIIKNENIFKPHRTHLYQYLVNPFGWSHLRVSFMYAFIQLLSNSLLIYWSIYAQEKIQSYILFLFVVKIMCYVVVRLYVRAKAIQKQKQMILGGN